MEGILEKVRKRFAFSEVELIKYINTAPHRYKTYPIPKRTGGTREISQPSKDLKVIQRYVLAEFLESKLEYHECATAYRPQRNIVDNVRPHVSHAYLLKVDFKNFFPSIKATDFVRYLRETSICKTNLEAVRFGKIFFKHTSRGLRLSIGSPGSPSISNALLKGFDEAVKASLDARGISYTRYSDDLTFSTDMKGSLFQVPKIINEILLELRYPTLKINEDKTVFSSKKFNRHVTGITITNEGKMSVGHLTKRHLRSRVHQAADLTLAEQATLRGYLSFVNQVEPDLIAKLRGKYPIQMAVLDAAVASPRRLQ